MKQLGSILLETGALTEDQLMDAIDEQQSRGQSLGRTLGPVWGNAALQRFGEAMPYLSATACIVVTFFLSLTYTVPESEF